MIPGIAVLAGLGFLVALSLGTLALTAPTGSAMGANVGYLVSIASFTVIQATLSARVLHQAGQRGQRLARFHFDVEPN